MAIWEILQRAEQNLHGRTEDAFNEETIAKLLEVRRQILEQIESRIVSTPSGKAFPYERVSIRLNPLSREYESRFRISFLQDGPLEADVQQILRDSGVSRVGGLDLSVALEPAPHSDSRESGPHFEVEFVKPVLSTNKDVPVVLLKVARGTTESAEYSLQKELILIGRSLEVTDREGRVIRKNDVIFNDNGEDANSTVSYSHARIWWDFPNQEFLIMDEISRYGTCILRDGRSLEVPAGNPCGMLLQSGDQIYLGQACVHFMRPPEPLS